jgi:hypothetical protein
LGPWLAVWRRYRLDEVSVAKWAGRESAIKITIEEGAW